MLGRRRRWAWWNLISQPIAAAAAVEKKSFSFIRSWWLSRQSVGRKEERKRDRKTNGCQRRRGRSYLENDNTSQGFLPIYVGWFGQQPDLSQSAPSVYFLYLGFQPPPTERRNSTWSEWTSTTNNLQCSAVVKELHFGPHLPTYAGRFAGRFPFQQKK